MVESVGMNDLRHIHSNSDNEHIGARWRQMQFQSCS